MTDPLRKRGYDGYDPNEPRIPKHHTGGGERTRDSVAAANNAGVRPGEPLPIPIFQGWDKPHEHQPPGHSLLTDIYDATFREPVRDVRELIAHPEDIPNAIASVAPGLGPIAEMPVVIAEPATSIRVPIGGAVARTAAGASAEAVAADSTAVDQTISLSRARFGQAAEHAADAQAAGQPSTLTIDRAGAAANRAAATGRIQRCWDCIWTSTPQPCLKRAEQTPVCGRSIQRTTCLLAHILVIVAAICQMVLEYELKSLNRMGHGTRSSGGILFTSDCLR